MRRPRKIRFRPASKEDFTACSKNLSWLIQEPYQKTQELLARIYGYADLHELQQELSKPGVPGPYDNEHPLDLKTNESRSRTDSHGRAKRVLESISTLKNLYPHQLLPRWRDAAKIGLFDKPGDHRVKYREIKHREQKQTYILPTESGKTLMPEQQVINARSDIVSHNDKTKETKTIRSVEQVSEKDLKSKGDKKMRKPAIRDDEFYRIEVGNMILIGILSADGPYISRIDNSRYEGVAIGPSCVTWHEQEVASREEHQKRYEKAMAGTPTVQQQQGEREQSGYYVAKYRTQLRIHLEGVTSRTAATIAKKFGMPFKKQGQLPVNNNFFKSDAFQGLKAWVKKHPIRAKKMSHYGQSYIPMWYEKAQGIK